MRLLIFAHSASSGGAEKALRNLVELLREHHHIEIAFPRREGSEPDYYKRTGITCHCIPAPLSAPHFSAAVLYYAINDWRQILTVLNSKQYELIITNTTAILHGAMLARELGVPHITYAHEALHNDDGLRPTSIDATGYTNIIEELSDQIIACSSFTALQFSAKKCRTILEPYDFHQTALERSCSIENKNVIQVIGQQSIRKRPDFAVTLAKSLRLRGTDAIVEIIGQENTGSERLHRQLKKRNIPHQVISGTIDNPYSRNIQKKVITLVCSHVEPYGLTIPESLRRGIPVLATKSGGPSEMLPEKYLFEIDNLDQCVRKAECVFNNYAQETLKAQELYHQLAREKSSRNTQSSINQLLINAAGSITPPEGHLIKMISMIRDAYSAPIGLSDVCNNISRVQSDDKAALSPQEIEELARVEKACPGKNACHDIIKFDVVPFAYSKQMDSLYKHGTGLAIELAAHFNDQARLELLSFIVCSLSMHTQSLKENVKILALGDGLGIDSIRLACAGFNVDYLDYEQSAMGMIASLNIQLALERHKKPINLKKIETVTDQYHAVVCLEVIEHVNRPNEFSDFMALCLSEGGHLYISECFNGVQDRWPTHLYSNERFSGMLPFILAKNFKLIDNNTRLYGKPFVFKKLLPGEAVDPMQLIQNRQSMVHLIQSQLDIGI